MVTVSIDIRPHKGMYTIGFAGKAGHILASYEEVCGLLCLDESTDLDTVESVPDTVYEALKDSIGPDIVRFDAVAIEYHHSGDIVIRLDADSEETDIWEALGGSQFSALCNGWERVPVDAVGFLVGDDMTLLSDDWISDDEGKYLYFGSLWYDPEYAIKSELERAKSPEGWRLKAHDTTPSRENVSEFVAAYAEALLWSTPQPEDDLEGLEAFDLDDFDDEAWREIVRDCAEFVAKHGYRWKLSERWGRKGASDSQAGHDFALTRNGHGTGFWDRPELYGALAAEALTKAAEEFGEVCLYAYHSEEDRPGAYPRNADGLSLNRVGID